MCKRRIMLKREKEIIGIIRYIAFDDRHRVLVEDELEWMKEKMKEIKRVVAVLPYIDFNGISETNDEILAKFKKEK
jgi:hypothetical protein